MILLHLQTNGMANKATLTSGAFTLQPAPAPLDFFGEQEEGSCKFSNSLYERDASFTAFINSGSLLLISAKSE